MLEYCIDNHLPSASVCVYVCVCVFVCCLTIWYLKLGLGHDAACYSERLADVIPCIGALNRWNGQLPVHGHRNAAISFCRLAGKQKILQGVKVGGDVTKSAELNQMVF